MELWVPECEAVLRVASDALWLENMACRWWAVSLFLQLRSLLLWAILSENFKLLKFHLNNDLRNIFLYLLALDNLMTLNTISTATSPHSFGCDGFSEALVLNRNSLIVMA